MPSVETSPLRDVRRRLIAFSGGVLITLAAFILVMYAVAWLAPALSHLPPVPGGPLLPVAILLMFGVINMVRAYRQRRGKRSAKSASIS